MSREILEKLEELSAGQKQILGRMDRLETRFEGLETRFEGLETRIGHLEQGQQELTVAISQSNEVVIAAIDALRTSLKDTRDRVRSLAS